ncbi:unnamed protein product, partial [Ixodes hexagonus]
KINGTANENICNTTACHARAKLITKLLNDDIDPCTDFYGYVCNNWIFNNPIPDDKTIRSSLYNLDDQLLKDLKGILENTTYQTRLQNVTDKVVVAYHNCINTSIPVEVQFGALKDVLKSVYGQYWPICRPPRNQRAVPSWRDLYIKIHNELDLHLFFILAVFKDPTNVTNNVISLDMPQSGSAVHEIMSLSEGTKLTPEQIAYLNLMGSSIKTFYPEITKPTILRIMQDILWFEGNISKIHQESKNKSGQEIHFVKKTIAGLYNVSKKLNWKSFLEKIFAPVNIELDREEPVVLGDEFYLRKVIKFVSKSRRSTVYNYMIWRVILNFAYLALPKFREMAFVLTSISTGAKRDYPEWMHCLGSIAGSRGVMDEAAGRLYIERKFSAGAKDDINLLVTELTESFKERLVDMKWMDHETKSQALTKLSHMVRHVGYADWIMNDTYLNAKYAHVRPVVLGEPFLVSYMDFRKQAGLQNLRELRKANNRKEDWASGPAIVNAFYSPEANSITFPAGILQAPLFEYGLPMHINLGAIGTVIGHEITHAFDNMGSQFDEEGNYRNWWTNATKEKFLEKIKCFEEEYGSIVDKRVHLKINGVQSKGENIADNGGLSEAYRAYRNWAAKTECGEAPSLPGLNLTSDQLFFVSFALTWCTNIRPKQLVSQIHNDPHCPARHRVNEPLKNTEEFSKAFSCPETSRMNKKDKCVLW